MLSPVAYKIPAGSQMVVKVGSKVQTVTVANESPIFKADIVATDAGQDGSLAVVYKGTVGGRSARFTVVLPS
jgi:hypothetical protein